MDSERSQTIDRDEPIRDSEDLAGLGGPFPGIEGFKFVRTIAQGGMGIVYEAEQESPRRRVAIKMIRAGLVDSDYLARFAHELARFAHEGQALALLSHPGIARVFQTGSVPTVAGPRPYIVMEVIEGKPLVEFARVWQLGGRERLGLLLHVCDAVEHAHGRGVIHRDLKPENIIVGEDGKPHIVDFGVARVSAGGIATLHTRAGAVLGTAAYMSPEQIRGDVREVDHQSDVYALGVIGYELLAGHLPLELVGLEFMEAVRRVADEEPASLGTVSREWRGDVATIFARALAKEKAERYGGVASLATDLRNFLSDQPILSRPPSTAYQFRKFARRNKALVACVAAVVITLSAGMFAAALQAARASRERDEAIKARSRAERFASLTTGIFEQARPHQKVGGDTHPLEVSARDILDNASKVLEAGLRSEPEALIRLQVTLAEANLGIFEVEEALNELERAQTQFHRLGPGGEALRLRTHANLVLAHACRHGRDWRAGMLQHRQEALALVPTVARRGDPECRDALARLAVILDGEPATSLGPGTEATRLWRIVLEITAGIEGPGSGQYGRMLAGHAKALHNAGQSATTWHGEATRAISILRAQDPAARELGEALWLRAKAELEADDKGAAIATLEEARAILEGLVGAPTYLYVLHDLAMLLHGERGDFAGARKLLRAFVRAQPLFSYSPSPTASTQGKLTAEVWKSFESGRLEEAARLARLGLDLNQALGWQGIDDEGIYNQISTLVSLLLADDRPAEALGVLQEYKAALGERIGTGYLLVWLVEKEVDVRVALNQAEEARLLREESARIRRARALPPKSWPREKAKAPRQIPKSVRERLDEIRYQQEVRERRFQEEARRDAEHARARKAAEARSARGKESGAGAKGKQ